MVGERHVQVIPWKRRDFVSTKINANNVNEVVKIKISVNEIIKQNNKESKESKEMKMIRYKQFL